MHNIPKRLPLLTAIIVCSSFAALVIFGCASDPASAVASPAISGLVAEDVLRDLENSATRILYDADILAQNRVNHAANELLVAISQARMALDGQTDKLVGALDTNSQKLVQSLWEINETLQSAESSAITILDEATINLENLSQALPLVKDEYGLRRVLGIQQLDLQQGYFTYTFRGNRLGHPTTRTRASIVGFSINEQDVFAEIQQDELSANERRVTLPRHVMEPLFHRHRLTVVPVTVDIVWETKRTFGGWRNDGSTTVTFATYLYPRYAGELQASGEADTYDWVPIARYSFNATSVNNHCSEDCDDCKSFPTSSCWAGWDEARSIPKYSASTKKQPGMQRLVGSGGYRRLSGANGSTRHETVTVTPGRLAFGLETNTGPINWEVWADREEWARTGVRKYRDSSRADFLSTSRLRLPVAAGARTITFKTSWGTTESFGLTKSGLIGDFIRVVSADNVGGRTVYTLEILPPKRFRPTQ